MQLHKKNIKWTQTRRTRNVKKPTSIDGIPTDQNQDAQVHPVIYVKMLSFQERDVSIIMYFNILYGSTSWHTKFLAHVGKVVLIKRFHLAKLKLTTKRVGKIQSQTNNVSKGYAIIFSSSPCYPPGNWHIFYQSALLKMILYPPCRYPGMLYIAFHKNIGFIKWKSNKLFL